jgi:hypothetical protein
MSVEQTAGARSRAERRFNSTSTRRLGYLSSATANAARVQRVVEACIDVGLSSTERRLCGPFASSSFLACHERASARYVVIAWQSSKAEAYTAEAAAFFGEMAELYKDRPNVLFEVYGRPIVSTWAGAIKP